MQKWDKQNSRKEKYMEKRKIRIIIGILCMVICTGGLMWRIIYINQRFPEETIIETKYGEFAVLQQGVELKVLGQEWIPFQEEEKQNGVDGYNYIVTVQLKNAGEEAVEADLTLLYIGLEGYANGIEMEKYLEQNREVGTLHPTLEKGETLEVKLVYNLLESQWKKKDWKHVTEKSYYLQKMCYPYIYRWNCS